MDETELRSNRFEKNGYFDGKLVTARDMKAEQDYHAARLETLMRHVVGGGLLCGVAVETIAEQDEGLTARLKRGLAIDHSGRPIVIENSGPVPIKEATTGDATAPSADEIDVYLEYDQSQRESVPIPGSESAFEGECEYNRVLEVFALTYEEATDEEPLAGAKAVPSIEFPSKNEVASDERSALTKPAREHYQAERSTCAIPDDPSVYLGRFERNDDAWERVTESEEPPLVYTNEMLYAAVVRHATDFDNPHDLTLYSPNDTIHITENAEKKRIDLDVVGEYEGSSSEPGSAEIVERIERLERQQKPLRRYVMNASLRHKFTAFSTVATRFESETADRIAEATKDAIDDEVQAYEDVSQYFQFDSGEDAYLAFIEEVIELEAELESELEDECTAKNLVRYSEALDDLREALEREENVLGVAVAQDKVCEAAEWLTGG